MLTFISAIIIGLIAAYTSGYAMKNMAWGSIIGIAAMILTQVLIGLYIRTRVNKINNAIQAKLQEVQAKIQRKVNMMQQKPGMSPKFMQSTIEKEQAQAVHNALEMTEQLKRYYLWSPLLARQIATMKMMFHYQIKEFDKADALMKKGGLMKALMGGGTSMPGSMPSGGGFTPFGGGVQTVSKKEQEKKKRIAKLKKKEKQKQRRKK